MYEFAKRFIVYVVAVIAVIMVVGFILAFTGEAWEDISSLF